MLQGLVDFDGYYLESDPCLVCNNPEVPYTVSVESVLLLCLLWRLYYLRGCTALVPHAL